MVVVGGHRCEKVLQVDKDCIPVADDDDDDDVEAEGRHKSTGAWFLDTVAVRGGLCRRKVYVRESLQSSAGHAVRRHINDDEKVVCVNSKIRYRCEKTALGFPDAAYCHLRHTPPHAARAAHQHQAAGEPFLEAAPQLQQSLAFVRFHTTADGTPYWVQTIAHRKVDRH